MSSLMQSKTRPAFGWAATSLTGASHEASGIPCQDAHTIQAGSCRGVPYLIAVVADGAGSARFAEEASKRATRLFADVVAEELPAYGFGALDDLVVDAAYKVHRTLCRLADEQGVSADEFATTLLGVIATRNRTACLQIGDGGIVTGPPWRLVFPPHHGEFRNETRFITDADAMDHVQHTVLAGNHGTIVLFTDGIEDLVITPWTSEVHPPLFDAVGRELAAPDSAGLHAPLSAQLEALMASGEVRSRTDDDITLLAIRLPGATP